MTYPPPPPGQGPPPGWNPQQPVPQYGYPQQPPPGYGQPPGKLERRQVVLLVITGLAALTAAVFWIVSGIDWVSINPDLFDYVVPAEKQFAENHGANMGAAEAFNYIGGGCALLAGVGFAAGAVLLGFRQRAGNTTIVSCGAAGLLIAVVLILRGIFWEVHPGFYPGDSATISFAVGLVPLILALIPPVRRATRPRRQRPSFPQQPYGQYPQQQAPYQQPAPYQQQGPYPQQPWPYSRQQGPPPQQWYG